MTEREIRARLAALAEMLRLLQQHSDTLKTLRETRH